MHAWKSCSCRGVPLGLMLAVAAVVGVAMPALCADNGERGSRHRESKSIVPVITISYRRVPLERVLDYISRSSRGVNVKISVDDDAELEELRRMLVTVELTNVTWRTAVAYIANKYRFVVNDDGEANGIILLERPPRVTLDVRNMEIANVIKLIATDAKANIIIGPEVQGTASFNIHDVPWKDALDSILKANGYIKVEETSGIIRITTPAQVQAVQEIRAVALKYLQPGGTRYTPKFTSEYAQRSGSSAGGSTDAANSLMSVLNQMKSPDGAISYEERTNMLVIKDTATRIEEMLDIIKQLDKEPLQVKISVRILSHTLDDSDEAGVDWTNGLTGAIEKGMAYSTPFPFSEGLFNSDADNMGILEPVFRLPQGPTALNQVFEYEWESAPEADEPKETYTLGSLSFESLQAVLKFAKTSSNVKVVQAPELVALDNQEATIHVGRIVRYAEFYVNTTDAGSESGYREVTPPIVAGVQLIVIPHVCGTDDKVIMEVVPKTEDFNDEWEVFGEGTENELRLPKTSKKVVVTKMMLRSTETGVIGGLMNNFITETNSSIPVLGDIPIIGKAFKKHSLVDRKENVLIFITPTILGPQDDDDFRDDLNSVRDLAASMGGTDFVSGDMEFE